MCVQMQGEGLVPFTAARQGILLFALEQIEEQLPDSPRYFRLACVKNSVTQQQATVQVIAVHSNASATVHFATVS